MTGSVTGLGVGGPGRPLNASPVEQPPVLFILPTATRANFILPLLNLVETEDYDMLIETQLCQKGQVGLPIVVQIVDEDGAPVNIAGTSGWLITLTPPDFSAALVRTAAILNDGLDGKIVYNTVTADVANVGSVRVQGQVTMPSGAIKLTRLGTLQIVAN